MFNPYRKVRSETLMDSGEYDLSPHKFRTLMANTAIFGTTVCIPFPTSSFQIRQIDSRSVVLIRNSAGKKFHSVQVSEETVTDVNSTYALRRSRKHNIPRFKGRHPGYVRDQFRR